MSEKSGLADFMNNRHVQEHKRGERIQTAIKVGGLLLVIVATYAIVSNL